MIMTQLHLSPTLENSVKSQRLVKGSRMFFCLHHERSTYVSMYVLTVLTYSKHEKYVARSLSNPIIDQMSCIIICVEIYKCLF